MSAPGQSPSQLPSPQRILFVEMWEENREVFKAIASDVLLFLLALSALFVGHLVLQAMEKAGYPHERAARVEELHYWAYLSVTVLFAADLIIKLFIFLFLRRRSVNA